MDNGVHKFKLGEGDKFRKRQYFEVRKERASVGNISRFSNNPYCFFWIL